MIPTGWIFTNREYPMAEGLAGWRDTWDRTRAASGGAYVFEDDDVLIATDFECGNGTNIRAEDDGYALDLEPEPGENQFSGDSYYFCFGARSKRKGGHAIRVTLRNKGREQWYRQTRHVVVRRGDQWGQLPREAIEGDEANRRLTLTLSLPPADADEPTLFFSNFHWHAYTDMMQWLRDTAEAHPEARLSVIGRSHLGRDMPCVEIGPEDPQAPSLVLAQTPQPSEMGQWSCRAVIEWLLGDTPDAKRCRRTHSVSFLPQTNPDGTVLGYCVSDGQGRFPFFEADRAAQGEADATPENVAVWEHLKRVRPWLFIEWHSNNWSRRAGHMLLRYDHGLMQDAVRRRIWEAWEERLLDLPDTHHSSWTGRKAGLYRSSMGYQAALKLNAAACMIKHHDKFHLRHILSHAVACVRAALHSYDEVMGRGVAP